MPSWPHAGIVAFAVLLSAASQASADELSRYQRPAVKAAITRIVQDAVAAAVGGRPYAPKRVPPGLEAPAGVFVTISRAGATRGCWGTVEAQSASLAAEIATNAARALGHDYRQSPIRASELAGLVAHVSILGALRPVERAAELQPRRYGLFVAAPGHGGVLLPGEAATATWQIATCRRKAGLSARDRAAMYRFETAVVGPIALAAQAPVRGRR